MSKRRPPARLDGPTQRRSTPKLPPADPPRKHFAFLLVSSIALVLWLAFLVAMACL